MGAVKWGEGLRRRADEVLLRGGATFKLADALILTEKDTVVVTLYFN